MGVVVVDMVDNRVARLDWAVLLRRSWEVVDSNSISSRDSMAVAVDSKVAHLGWVASRPRCWGVGRMPDSNSNISSSNSSKDSIAPAVVDWDNSVRWRVASWEVTASRRLGTMRTGTRATEQVVAHTRARRHQRPTHRREHTVGLVEATGSKVAGMASSKDTDSRSTCNNRNRVAMANSHTFSTAHPAAATAHRNHSSTQDTGLRKALTAVVAIKAGMGRRVARIRLRGTSNNSRKGTHSSNIRRATISTPARHRCRSISRRRMEDNNREVGTDSRWEGTMDSNSSIRHMLADSSSRVDMGSKGATGVVVGTVEEGTSRSGDDAGVWAEPGVVAMGCVGCA